MHILLVTLFFVVGLSQTAQAASDLEGLWLTENKRSVISVEPCDGNICGYIHWIIDGGMEFDVNNPDTSKRKKSMCDLKILWGMKKKNETRWEKGKIYKADDGDTYDSFIELVQTDRLKVRGYMGVSFLGKTQYWTRVDESEYSSCTK